MLRTRKQGVIGPIEIILIVLLIATLGFVGWRVMSGQDTTETDTDMETEAAVETEQPTEEDDARQVGTYSAFTIDDTEFEDRGSCDDGAVLFAPIYNADSFDYDCESEFKYRFGYASVFFGESSEDVFKLIDKDYSGSSEVVELANGAMVAKAIITTSEPSADGNSDYIYHVYQANSMKVGYFYAVYRTFPGNSGFYDVLDEFEDAVLNHWTLK